MAKIVPSQEVGLGEGVGRVRISTSRARRGKILAVEHPIFGWLPYRQWALLRLVPEDRILPAIIVGVSTFTITKIVMDLVGAAVDVVQPPLFGGPPGGGSLLTFILNLIGIPPQLTGALDIPLPIPVEEAMKSSIGEQVKDNPLPFYVATMAAGLTLAGLDPGTALLAFATLLDAITPLT